MLTYGKLFDKEIFIVEYEKNFHGNFITHFINQHKHFVQSTLKYYYADWKTAELNAEHDRNHVESTLFYNQSKEPPESLLFGESFDVALNQDIIIDTTYKEYGCPFNLLNPGAKKMCGSFANHGIDYVKTNYNIEHDYKVILVTTSLRGDTINKQDYFDFKIKHEPYMLDAYKLLKYNLHEYTKLCEFIDEPLLENWQVLIQEYKKFIGVQ